MRRCRRLHQPRDHRNGRASHPDVYQPRTYFGRLRGNRCTGGNASNHRGDHLDNSGRHRRTAGLNRPTVQVTDASGNPVVGVTVTFTVTAGGGSVTGGSSPTGLGGIAQVTSWTLGTVAGSNTLDASVGSLAPVAFEAAAQAGPPAKLAISTAPRPRPRVVRFWRSSR